MTLLESTPDELHFVLEHKGFKFEVTGVYLGDGRLILDPVIGWNELAVSVNQDIESLYEDLDETIYNAMPELFEVNT